MPQSPPLCSLGRGSASLTVNSESSSSLALVFGAQAAGSAPAAVTGCGGSFPLHLPPHLLARPLSELQKRVLTRTSWVDVFCGLCIQILLPLISRPSPSLRHRWACGPGVDMISKMLKMQMLEDEDDLAYAETEKKARTDSTSDGRPAWMRTLHTTASNWLHLIPQTLSHLKRTVENIKVPAVGGAAPRRLWPRRAGRTELSVVPAGPRAQVRARGGDPVKLARSALRGGPSAYARPVVPGPSPWQASDQLRPRPGPRASSGEAVSSRAPRGGPGVDGPASHGRGGLSLTLPFTLAFPCL